MPAHSEAVAAARILIVEDELMLAEDMGKKLRSLGYEVAGMVVSGEDAVQAVEELRPDLIVMDIKLEGDVDGIEACRRITSQHDIPVVYVSAFAEKDVLDRAKKTRPYGYLSKPLGLLELRITVETALYKHNADKRLRDSEHELQLVSDAVSALVAHVAPDERFLWANRAYGQFFDLPAAELKGRHVRDVLGEESYASVHNYIEAALCGVKISFEISFFRDSGEVKHLSATYVPNIKQDGTVHGFIVQAVDITERKKAEQALRESEEKYRQLAELLPQHVFEVDKRGLFTFTNRAGRDLLGYTTGDLEASSPESVSDVLAPEDRARALEDFARVRQGEKVTGAEYTLLKKDGSTVPVVSFIAPVRKDGVVVGARGVAVDISHLKRMQEALRKAKNHLEIRVQERTSELEQANSKLRTEVAERKRAEEALRISEEKYRQLVQNASEGILVAQDGKLKYVNPRCLEWTGYSEEELTARPFLDLVHADDKEMVKQNHALRMKGSKKQIRIRARILDKAGSIRVMQMTAGPIDWEGRPAALCLLTDITERLHAEEALKASEEKYRGIIENMDDAYFESDLAGNMTFFNKSTCRLLGYTPEELMGMNNRKYMDKASAKAGFSVFNQVYRNGESATVSGWNIVRKDGTRRTLETQVSLIRDRDGKPCGFRGYSRDVTEKKQAEAALLESEAKYRAIIENIEEGYYEVDIAGNMKFCNDAMCKIIGRSREELIGRNNREYMDENTSKQVFRAFNSVYRTGRPVTVPGWRLIIKGGRNRSIDTSIALVRDSDGKALGFRGIVRDVTERERLQMESAQAQKMQAIGTLAGGIAHDFNNILYAIMGFAELCLDEAPDGTLLRRNLETVLNSASRAKDLVSHILTFSRQDQHERGLISVVPIVKEAIKFLRASLPSTIEIKQFIQPELASIIADPTQIHQILMNLGTNAGHAMRLTGGVLEITLENVAIEDQTSIGDPGLVPGPYLRMTVGDTGTGMDTATVQRIFEPYFTTKQKGEGTGLGLAVVHGIVSSYGGCINVESEVGQGSTFRVYLPSVQARASEETGTIELVPTGCERILYVDDEPVIVQMAEQMLRRLGYEVVSRTDSLEALELFRGQPNDFDLIITDLTMPNLTGVVFAQEVRKISPQIPLILCTGFSELVSEGSIESLGIGEVVRKPILKKDLAEAIRRALDR